MFETAVKLPVKTTGPTAPNSNLRYKSRPAVRLRREIDRVSVGHAAIPVQFGWCAKARVRRAISNHCGSAIVRETWRSMNALVGQLGREHGLDARLARDGDQLPIAAKVGVVAKGRQRYAPH